jgi:glycosyltransferase involved in cell wall biosynthesis
LFSYHAASALSERGWLSSFQTGVTSDTALARLSSRVLRNSKDRLLNRVFADVPRSSRRSYLYWEAISRAGRHLKPGGLTSQTNWYDVLFCGHDWQVSRHLEKGLAAVYTYEDGARLTLEAARRRNIATVYELPLGYYLGVAGEMQRAIKTSPGMEAQIRSEPAWKRARKDTELDLADLVIVPCEWARESLSFNKSLKKPVLKIPYATPAADMSARTERPTGPFTILFAGQIGVRKGVPLLLEAWKRLRLKDARLLLAGSMNLDEKYLGRYTNFHYLGALPRVRLLEVMKEVDLFVFPSVAEGFGLVIGEAMAAGVPVLTTRNTGGPELITDGREGWCVPAHDMNALAERIEWAHRNRDRVYEMGIMARRSAERWTWADYRRKLAEELTKHLGA